LKILLVRLRLIGDVVFTTPLVRALRRRFPDSRLVYIVESTAAPVVARNPHLDEVLTIAHTRGLRRLRDDVKLAAKLRAARFDVAIDLHGGPRAAWLTWATRAPTRVGYDVRGRAWMYTHVVHRPRRLGQRHSVESQWDLLGAVDAALPTDADRSRDRVEMPVDPSALAAVEARLAARGVPRSARLVVLHVSAGNPFRRWPRASFAELASDLAAHDERRWVLVTSGPSDRDAVRRVVADARARAGAAAARVIESEDLTLAELRALMERAALFVGGDSGPLHVASTSNVPIVGLYGPTLPERSAPWRPSGIPSTAIDAGSLPCRPCDQRVCTPGDFRCLTSVPASRVREAAERLLKSPLESPLERS
jgi:lipopolysaccharide heptosyltransferase II